MKTIWYVVIALIIIALSLFVLYAIIGTLIGVGIFLFKVALFMAACVLFWAGWAFRGFVDRRAVKRLL